MGIGLFLFIVAAIVLVSLEYQIDLKCLHDDYQEWKNRRMTTRYICTRCKGEECPRCMGRGLYDHPRTFLTSCRFPTT